MNYPGQRLHLIQTSFSFLLVPLKNEKRDKLVLHWGVNRKYVIKSNRTHSILYFLQFIVFVLVFLLYLYARERDERKICLHSRMEWRWMKLNLISYVRWTWTYLFASSNMIAVGHNNIQIREKLLQIFIPFFKMIRTIEFQFHPFIQFNYASTDRIDSFVRFIVESYGNPEIDQLIFVIFIVQRFRFLFVCRYSSLDSLNENWWIFDSCYLTTEFIKINETERSFEKFKTHCRGHVMHPWDCLRSIRCRNVGHMFG